MNIRELLGMTGGILEYFLPLIFGFATLLLQTKNFEDEYDQKIKEISIVYDNKFEEKLSEYVVFKARRQREEYKTCRNRIENNPLYEWSRLHEIFAVVSEFEIGKRFIQSQEFDDYVRSKTSFGTYLTSLFTGRDYNS